MATTTTTRLVSAGTDKKILDITINKENVTCNICEHATPNEITIAAIEENHSELASFSTIDDLFAALDAE